MKKYILYFILFAFTITINAQPSDVLKKQQAQDWLELVKKKDINSLYDRFLNSKTTTMGDICLDSLERYYYVNSLAKVIKIKNEVDAEVREVLKILPEISTDGMIVNRCLEEKKLGVQVFYNYYFLKLLSEGVPIKEADGGAIGNTSMTELFNSYYYEGIEYYLRNGNDALKLALIPRIMTAFRYNGYTDYLDKLLPLVKSSISESKEKKELLETYVEYEPLKIGSPAPNFILKNEIGGTVSLSDFRGKVVVIDVWATWCTWCIEKLPHYIDLASRFRNSSDSGRVKFLTISIDAYSALYEWKYTIPSLGLLGFTNLFANVEGSTFVQDYKITGIPRYMVIDPYGKIFSLYIPGADSPNMTDAIYSCLK